MSDAAMDSDLTPLAASVLNRLQVILSKADAFRARPPERSVILTDWTVLSAQAWTTFSFVATYLGWHLQARPIGMSLNIGAITPIGTMIEQAFGYAGRVDLMEYLRAAASSGAIAGQIDAELAKWPKEGQALRDCLLNLTFDGLPVGDLVYDAHLRGTGRPTIEVLDGHLRNDIVTAALFHKAAQRILDSWDVKAVVTAHRIYYQLGIISRMALSRGIPLIESGAVNPFRIKHYRNFLEAMDEPLRLAPEELERVLTSDREQALAYGRRYMAERQAGAAQLHLAESDDGAYGGNRRVYDREALCQRIGWDTERPIVVIMTHVFTEGPHFGRNLYDDFYQWIAETLRIAATNDKVLWLVKGHPDAVYFEDQTRSQPTAEAFDDTLRRLVAPYADCPHIALAPNDLNTGSLVSMTKAVITLFGSAGIEFTALGIPAVTAAEACYHGHGFTVECRSRQAYEHVLRTVQDLPAPTLEQRERALAFFYLMQVKSRPVCNALPPLAPLDWWSPRQDRAMLEGMRDRLDDYIPRDDPLYRRLVRMLRENHSSAYDFP